MKVPSSLLELATTGSSPAASQMIRSVVSILAILLVAKFHIDAVLAVPDASVSRYSKHYWHLPPVMDADEFAQSFFEPEDFSPAGGPMVKGQYPYVVNCSPHKGNPNICECNLWDTRLPHLIPRGEFPQAGPFFIVPFDENTNFKWFDFAVHGDNVPANMKSVMVVNDMEGAPVKRLIVRKLQHQCTEAEVRFFLPHSYRTRRHFVAYGRVITENEPLSTELHENVDQRDLGPLPQPERIEAYHKGQQEPFAAANHTSVLDFEVWISPQVNLFSMLLFCVLGGAHDLVFKILRRSKQV